MKKIDIKKQYLEGDEYYSNKTDKTTIVLHHTAGSHRPDWVISSWDRDRTKGGRPLRVATQFVVGGKSTRDGNTDWDGKIVQCLPTEMWAHHIGTKNSNNVKLNEQSIGIEICNYGPLVKSIHGEFFTYVNSKVPEEDVIDLGKNWRGYRYYQKYTDSQIESVKFLIEKYSLEYGIDVCKGMVELFDDKQNFNDLPILEIQENLNSLGYLGLNGKRLTEDGINGGNTKYSLRTYNDTKRGDWGAFEFNKLANHGGSGIWSHTNYRKDKFDIYPYPPLIEMLKSL